MVIPLKKENAELCARIAALEARPVIEYDDIWQPDKSYRVGQLVTYRGSLWACRATTTTQPGTSKDWRLAVKRGRDAKDRVAA